MGKTKYKYNPESLRYEEVEQTFIGRLKKISYYFVSSIVFCAIVLAVSFNGINEYIKTEAEKDNAKVRAELDKFYADLEDIIAVLDNIQDRDDNIYRSIFEVKPYPEYKRKLGTGGNSVKFKKYQGLKNESLLIDISKKVESIEKKLVAQSRSFDEVVELTKTQEQMLKCIPSIQPISNKDLKRIASGFGMRMHPIHKIMKMHAGLDFTAPIGTEIYATGDGVVELAKWNGGYGRCVVINHGFGYKTKYAHCKKLNCRKGQKIKRGEVIAFLGNTGQSSGPHLHYEVIKKNNKVNPVNYFFNDLSPQEYQKVIELSSRPTQSM
ncbi:MAG: peptidase M23 [Crocinitomicaceae bacterium]|nr:peptidase M23 [Crocinitomicaceae bacterium]